VTICNKIFVPALLSLILIGCNKAPAEPVGNKPVQNTSSAVNASQSDGAPFGLKWGLTKEDLHKRGIKYALLSEKGDCDAGELGCTYRIRIFNVPSPLKDKKINYSALMSSNFGLVGVTAGSVWFQGNKNEKYMDAYHRLVDIDMRNYYMALTGKYGKGINSESSSKIEKKIMFTGNDGTDIELSLMNLGVQEGNNNSPSTTMLLIEYTSSLAVKNAVKVL
jgi:hypothetical protein